jgi:hypothetical protein
VLDILGPLVCNCAQCTACGAGPPEVEQSSVHGDVAFRAGSAARAPCSALVQRGSEKDDGSVTNPDDEDGNYPKS